MQDFVDQIKTFLSDSHLLLRVNRFASACQPETEHHAVKDANIAIVIVCHIWLISGFGHGYAAFTEENELLTNEMTAVDMVHSLPNGLRIIDCVDSRIVAVFRVHCRIGPPMEILVYLLEGSQYLVGVCYYAFAYVGLKSAQVVCNGTNY